MALDTNAQYNINSGKDAADYCYDYKDEITEAKEALDAAKRDRESYESGVANLQCFIDNYKDLPGILRALGVNWHNAVRIEGKSADNYKAFETSRGIYDAVADAEELKKDMNEEINDLDSIIEGLERTINELQDKALECFPFNTKVLTENGYKDIDKITINDKVLSYNENTKENELKDVLRTIIHKDVDVVMYKLLINGNII